MPMSQSLFMTQRTSPDNGRVRILSKPTTCLHCHLTIQMEYSEDTQGEGRWNCPQCAHVYPSKFWKIKKASKVA